MCGITKETNRHAMCYCTNKDINNHRQDTALIITNLAKSCGGNGVLHDILRYVFGPHTSNRAATLKDTHTIPRPWRKAWHKGRIIPDNRTQTEKMQALAAETAIKLGGAMPLWLGIQTKAWTYMLHKRNIKPKKTRERES